VQNVLKPLVLALSVSLAGVVIGSQYTDQEVENVAPNIKDSEKEQRGKITLLEGRARKLPLLSEEWMAAYEGNDVISGDKMKTLRDSRAELTLKELNVIRMAPLTTIDVVKLYEETKEGRDETLINLEKGDIWAMVSQIEEEVEFNISTPVAGAAITGTRFRISVADDSSTVLKVYQGEVSITNAPDKDDLLPLELPHKAPQLIQGPKLIPGPRQVTFEEWYYIVKKMQKIRIGPKGQLLASEGFTLEDPDEQTEWVRWNQERDREINK
jgi:hypothetical protein